MVGVRLTAEEYERVAKLARAEHVPLGAWVRGRLLKAIDAGASLEATIEKQAEALEESRIVLQEVRRLYQPAISRYKRSGDRD